MRIGITLTLLVAVPLAGCGDGSVATTSDLLITGARIVDTDAEHVGAVSDVLIREGRIAAIAPPGELTAKPGTDVLNASSLYLMPGLIDVHAHLGDGGLGEITDEDREIALRQFLRYGVTTIFVPGGGGGNDEQIAEWKQRCDSDLECPRILGSGNIITAHGSHPISTIWGFPADVSPAVVHARGATGIGEQDDIEALIRAKAGHGVDAIKIVVEDGPGAFAPKPRLSREQVAELCAAAHRYGLRTFAHVSLAAHVDDVVNAGCDGIMHAPDDRLSEQTLQTMAARGVFYVATLSLFDALVDQEAGRRDQESYAEAGVSPRALASFEDDAYWSVPAEDPEIIAQWTDALRHNLVRAAELGVPIALGTDTNNPQIFPGYAAHEELALLVEHGLTASQALRSATTTAAEFLNMSSQVGRIETGYAADILVLSANPLDDILNTRTIEFVIADGERVDNVVSTH